jgi:hypothetical protein
MLAAVLVATIVLSGRLTVPVEELAANGKPCDVRGTAWSCDVEPGDIRLAPKGDAPVYLFGVSTDSDAGTLTLHRGAAARRSAVRPDTCSSKYRRRWPRSTP